ncbi:hypothetical protein [Chondrinema litorale]|uniref:hypothetical protein n=1 Tax=Chondrinema litorale TaxID=2994555 RepID=UPI002542C802|nr:hypothetical protein [Chondrinema litorale]UZR97510.1 hypothetical protein OQ292_27265 [Chondrinema litorale]
MSTWTAIYINNSDQDKVIKKLKQLTNIDNEITGEFPDNFHNRYLLDIKSNPSFLVIGKTQDDWITIRHNSFSKLVKWGKEISDDLASKVIVTAAQSVSSAYYFALYDNGEKIREIEVCYSTDDEIIDFGNHFDFENEAPGLIYKRDEKISYIFDFESIEEYCIHFGLKIQTDYNDYKWTILKSKYKQLTMVDYVKHMHKKNKKSPWWKFW